MTKRAPATVAPGRSRLREVLLVLGIVLLAANLRPALTSVAPLIGQIRAGAGISNGVTGLPTTLPLLAFGLLSPVAHRGWPAGSAWTVRCCLASLALKHRWVLAALEEPTNRRLDNLPDRGWGQPKLPVLPAYRGRLPTDRRGRTGQGHGAGQHPGPGGL